MKSGVSVVAGHRADRELEGVQVGRQDALVGGHHRRRQRQRADVRIEDREPGDDRDAEADDEPPRVARGEDLEAEVAERDRRRPGRSARPGCWSASGSPCRAAATRHDQGHGHDDAGHDERAQRRRSSGPSSGSSPSRDSKARKREDDRSGRRRRRPPGPPSAASATKSGMTAGQACEPGLTDSTPTIAHSGRWRSHIAGRARRSRSPPRSGPAPRRGATRRATARPRSRRGPARRTAAPCSSGTGRRPGRCAPTGSTGPRTRSR